MPRRPRGVWYYPERKLWYGEFQRDGRKFKTKGCDTQAEAAAALAQLRRDVGAEQDAGIDLDGRTMTVAHVVDLFLTDRARLVDHGLAEETHKLDVQLCRHIVTHLGDRKAAQLTSSEVESMLASLRRRLSASYTARVRSTLALAYKAAAKRRLVLHNPAQLADTVKGATLHERRLDPLPEDEAERVLKVARPHRLGVAAFLAVRCGLRPPELRGLLISDVDLNRGVLSVTGQADRAGRRTTAKHPQAQRRIGLDDDMVAVLRAHLEVRHAEEEHGLYPPSPLVIVSEVGTPVDANNLRHKVGDWCDAAGVRTRTTYDLRSTCGQIAYDQGMPTHKIAELLGDRVSTIEKHYVGQDRDRLAGTSIPVGGTSKPTPSTHKETKQ